MRQIILLTKNNKKLEAYQRHFSLYGIKVIMDSIENKERLIKDKEDNTIAIIWDQSNLFNRITNQISNKKTDMELVYNRTTLYYYIDKELQEIHSERINGYIDLSKKENVEERWWDDIFVLSKLGMTYKELNQKGMKNSGREEVISKFIIDILYYKEKVDLNFNPQKNERTIQFDGNSIDLVNNNKYLNTPSNKVFNNIFNLSLNNGAFFRSAKNRREKNYWIPGLNAGIPLVPKRDSIHEITFAVHDLSHFIMPDLICNFMDSKKERKIYIVHRMMSEAITMVYADMLFIDGLKKDGIDYDFTKRNIYPLYEKIKHHNLKDILYANVIYCLTGSDKEYVKLLNGQDLDILERFKNKYMPFFVEDYKWTIKNYENMKNNKDTFQEWTKDLSVEMKDNNLMTTLNFKNELYNVNENYSDNLIDSIFEYVVENIYFKAMKTESNQNREENISNSFKRYMIGQMNIFYKFDFISISKTYKNKIKGMLSQDILNKNEIDSIRKLYEEYLKNILELNLINLDDFNTYKETYPIFDSFFVFYDKNKEYYTSLEDIYKITLGEENE